MTSTKGGATLAFVFAGVVLAQPSDHLASAQAYVTALNRLMSGVPDTSLEHVYSLAVGLVMPPHLDSMSDVEFQALRSRLPGFALSREEVPIAEPEPAFFLNLAKRYGRAADRAYFALHRIVRPWPVYIQQHTDYSGCTIFGQGKLVDTYQGWSHFRDEFPGVYVNSVGKALADIEDQVARSTCACGDPDSVSQELTEFSRTFPKSAAAGAATARAKAVREHRSTISFNCVSG